MKPTIAITAAEWDIVRGILERHVPGHEVWAFGSRANGTCKPFSDLDLAILAAHPLPLSVIADLADAFSESDLPYKVDIVDWATTSERFRGVIKAGHIVLQPETSQARGG